MTTGVDFNQTKSSNYTLCIDNFKGVLREYVYRDVIQTSTKEEALIEIFLEGVNRKYDIFEGIKSIPSIDVIHHHLFIRLTSLSRTNTYNNRFNLKDVINLYDVEKLHQKVTLFNDKNKISLAKIRLLAQFMAFKVKAWKLISIFDQELRSHSALNHDTILPWSSMNLKLNCNFDIQQRIDHHHMLINQILLYRGILTVSPLQTVAIVYDNKEDKIKVHIYDINGSW
mmetsp:Transcript_35026/g.31567  ORF Transcript_35026/g.31567 Transcript_35026/m.31567 type:complete len:227 (-) Transcript_35026:111-791(-)|eukprot:CAMPEP_0114588478 /NCGR_PEP_ID=MMETSP0125-20121206/11169_1 /TAXON_ID=485358 ORGANISM="Aristerostoma sp., Strain ATCC 50986" /NCGR_SAMPLE_ID=MMETSP0125 /ASSEMBLY_ACC=CAM_ASM_000245 /LENGTH=226 /DNA_ID=CAMNT_0001784891 /DNA_START=1219 /DNA_END=1899 /DNA_ORIENTATION=+